MAFTGEIHAGVHPESPKETDGFTLNHSMLRIKDPEISLDFYTRIMGMRVLRRLEFSELDFSLYFLAKLQSSDHPPEEATERTEWTFNQRSILELTHNWGTEKDSDFKYHDGNDKPQGFGHICFSVPDLDTAIAWFDQHKVEYVKRPNEGALKDVAFIKDPDGYWIEIIQPSRLRQLGLSKHN